MGNCCRHESSMTWGGEDWGTTSEAHDHETFPKERTLEEKEDLKIKKNDMLMTENTTCNKNGTSSTDQVKIKITKKQLEELLGKIDIHGVPVEQVLAQLMNGGSEEDQYHMQQRSWRPALQSIPEVN